MMQRVCELVARTHGELLVSKYRLRQAEGIALVRRPPRDQLLSERRFVLQVTGHPEFGLPFGQDRLVPIFLATLSVRQQSQTVRFKSASAMLGAFGMAKGGKEYRSVDYSRPRRFVAMLDQWLQTIRAVWPECPARLNAAGQRLQISNSSPLARRACEGGR